MIGNRVLQQHKRIHALRQTFNRDVDTVRASSSGSTPKPSTPAQHAVEVHNGLSCAMTTRSRYQAQCKPHSILHVILERGDIVAHRMQHTFHYIFVYHGVVPSPIQLDSGRFYDLECWIGSRLAQEVVNHARHCGLDTVHYGSRHAKQLIAVIFQCIDAVMRGETAGTVQPFQTMRQTDQRNGKWQVVGQRPMPKTQSRVQPVYGKQDPQPAAVSTNVVNHERSLRTSGQRLRKQRLM